jgi:hopanoid biosynthesis associated protein HpnK
VLRRLVVNADDLGLTLGVNSGIYDAHDRGVLTSASLFANAPATADAIYRARFRPSLGIGAHLTLVDGAPTLPPNRVPSLVRDDGRFRTSWKPFIVACLRGHVALGEVELELAAQIDRLRAEGLRLTHLDAHKHVHAFPPIFAIVVRLAARFGIPTVRVPYEPWSRVWGNDLQRRTARRQALANALMLPWARRDYRTASAFGVRTPQFGGRIHTGVMSTEWLEAWIHHLRKGITELMVHPGYVDDALRRTGTRLLSSRADEADLLCSPAVQALVAANDIQLIRHDLEPLDTSLTRSLRHVS